MVLAVLKDRSGQMNVELAVLVPVVIVIGLVVYNLAVFVSFTATFDRVAADAIVALGVSPSGYATKEAAVSQIKAEIERNLDNPRLVIEVSAAGVYEDTTLGSGIVFPMSPLLTRYSAIMKYRPWPTSLSVAGTHFDPPIYLTYEKSLVVDRFRPGVVF